MFSDGAAAPGSGGPFGGPYDGFTAPTKAGETDKVSSYQRILKINTQ